MVPAMQDHDQETEVVEEDAAATEEIVEENENEEVPEEEAPEVPLTPEAEASSSTTSVS